MSVHVIVGHIHVPAGLVNVKTFGGEPSIRPTITYTDTAP